MCTCNGTLYIYMYFIYLYIYIKYTSMNILKIAATPPPTTQSAAK